MPWKAAEVMVISPVIAPKVVRIRLASTAVKKGGHMLATPTSSHADIRSHPKAECPEPLKAMACFNCGEEGSVNRALCLQF